MSLRREDILPLLQTQQLGRGEYRWQEEMASTNAVAKEMARSGAPEGSVAVCDRQGAGRGRLGRTWIAAPGEDLTQSAVHYLKDTAQAPLVPLAAALAVCHTLTAEGLKPQIKWPNDLLLNGRKVCGILCELCGNAAVIGVGINVNRRNFPAELQATAGSLYLEAGHPFRLEALFAAYLFQLEKMLFLLEQKGKAALLSEYRPRCITLGKSVRVVETGGEWMGTALDIDENGCLLVQNASGETLAVRAGDVSVRGLMGYADTQTV